jgi:NitT/TauT family transport system permease protein
LLALLGLWETASRLGLVPVYFLPPFSRVVVNMFRQVAIGNLGIQTINSFRIILGGFGIAFGMAILIALLSSLTKAAETLFATLATIFNPLPPVALMPLIILWFGINTSAMFAIIVHSVLWALVRQLIDGIRAIPKVYYEWSDNIELTFFQKFTGVLLYAILPELVVGVRIGWGRAWRSLIGAEMIFGMIGALGGLGFYIYSARAFANITNVMSAVIIIIIIGMFFESVLFNQLEKRTVRKWGMVRG